LVWLAFCGAVAGLQAQAPEAGPSPAPQPSRADERADALTPEERQRLHEALSQAWEDPEVVRARQEVHRATEAYRRVLRDTVSRIDPDVVPVMGKLHEKSRVEAFRHQLPPDFPAGPGMLPRDPAAAVDALAQAEARFRSLEGPDREHFLRVAKRLGESGVLRPALAPPPPDREKEKDKEKNGRDVFKHRRELRERFLREMARSDPRVAEILASAPPRPPRPLPEPGVTEPTPVPPVAP
jgi:hypothetical protein